MDYGNHFARRGGSTPQTVPIAGRETEMVENNAGGYTFQVGDFAQLDRFLILGSEGGSYYVREREMTVDNAQCVLRCIAADGPRTVARIVEISDSGRAPKNDPALFALALCAAAKDDDTRAAALAALPKVARIGTHLFHFAQFVQTQRGWGRGLRRAIAAWYQTKPVDKLAYDAVKYRQRDGWTHRDLLRLAHPLADADDVPRRATYDWICGRGESMAIGLPVVIAAFESLKGTPNAITAVANIDTFNLPREAIPTELLNDVKVWRALLKRMPMHAMVRNLGKMTAIGLLKPLSDEVKQVCEYVTNQEHIRHSRLHPLAILVAQRIYAQGHGDKGSLTWTPVPQIIDALDKAFYLAFGNVEPTGKTILLALDVSGSMGMDKIAGMPITPREAAAAMALVIANVEPNHAIMGFGHQFMPLNISAGMRLDTAIASISNIPFSSTDCSLPWIYAAGANLPVDAVVTITDNETYAGRMHPTEALAQFRRKMNRPWARNIVMGMTATEFTINDPADPLGLDVVGFDAAVPALISDFIRG